MGWPSALCALSWAACVFLAALAACCLARLLAGRRSSPHGFRSNDSWRRGTLAGTRRPYGFATDDGCDRCRGITSGAMPAIEPTDDFGNGLCCGRLGVPP